MRITRYEILERYDYLISLDILIAKVAIYFILDIAFSWSLRVAVKLIER